MFSRVSKVVTYVTKTNKYVVGIALVALMFSLLACSAAQSSRSFTGSWDSEEWGVLDLQQTDNRVVGTYVYLSTEGQMYGQVEGSLDGNRLDLTWWESTEPAVTYEESFTRGGGYLILAEDGRSVSGAWEAYSIEESTGEWTFTRW